MSLNVLRAELQPYYIPIQKKETIARIDAEEELHCLFADRKLSLENYLNKYSSQLVIDVVVLQENGLEEPQIEPEMQPETQPCYSASIDSVSPSTAPPYPPIKSIFIQRPSKASKRGPNGNEN